MIITDIVSGLKRSWNLKKIIGVFWLFNLIIAIVFLKPYLNAFETFISGRLITQVLAKSNIFTYYKEFYHFMEPAVQASKYIFSVGIFIHLLLMVLLGGGLLHFIVREEKITLRTFWTQCGKFLGRMLRLALWTILLIFVVVIVVILILMLFGSFLPSHFVENIYFYFYTGGVLFGSLLLLFVFMMIDSARIFIVKDDGNSTRSSLLKSLRLFRNYPFHLLGSYLLIILLEILLFLFYWWLQNYIPDTRMWGIVAGFIVLQCSVFLLFWLRFSRYGVIMQYVLRDMSQNFEN